MLGNLFLILGALLLVIGVGAVFVPAAAILAGGLCLALGWGLVRSERPSERPSA